MPTEAASLTRWWRRLSPAALFLAGALFLGLALVQLSYALPKATTTHGAKVLGIVYNPQSSKSLHRYNVELVVDGAGHKTVDNDHFYDAVKRLDGGHPRVVVKLVGGRVAETRYDGKVYDEDLASQSTEILGAAICGAIALALIGVGLQRKRTA